MCLAHGLRVVEAKRLPFGHGDQPARMAPFRPVISQSSGPALVNHDDEAHVLPSLLWRWLAGVIAGAVRLA